PLANRVVGTISATISRSGAESPLGRVIADAQLQASDGANEGNAVIAFMNPGGVRTDLLYKADTTPSPGQVTYGDIFAVQPFGNNITVKTFTGQQIKDILEQQFNADGSIRILLQVSDSLRYSYDRKKPVGERVLASTLRINGTPVNLTRSYRVSMNSFLADGGDSFSGFRAGTMTLGGATDTDAFEAYLAANPGLAPPTTQRVTDATP
ncbi:MAG: 5'-nucleotidase C-terminal domain-containing protein, partial [Solirubrobacteraceae bacterium]